jgi:hypothetical protein
MVLRYSRVISQAISETDNCNAHLSQIFSTENKSYEDNNPSSQRTHEDLIRSCSTFRNILSAEVACSCDYSML